jgi:hypothetical protein
MGVGSNWLRAGQRSSQSSRPDKVKNFSLLQDFQSDSGAIPASCPVGTGALCPVVKWPESEADHSPPTPIYRRGLVRNVLSTGTTLLLPYLS